MAVASVEFRDSFLACHDGWHAEICHSISREAEFGDAMIEGGWMAQVHCFWVRTYWFPAWARGDDDDLLWVDTKGGKGECSVRRAGAVCSTTRKMSHAVGDWSS